MTFDAPAGKVVYVGDLVIGNTGASTLAFRTEVDSERARAHLRSRFPKLADRMMDGIAVLQMQTNLPCPRER